MEGTATNFMLAAAMTAASLPAVTPQAVTPPASAPRHIDEIIIHCSATPAGRDVTAADIRRWHLARGFADIGYHFVVRLSGQIEAGRPLSRIGAHCLGHNRRSIGVCYIGGCDSAMHPADTRTPEQRKALRKLIIRLLMQFPGARIHSHGDFAAKACPSFDATKEYSSLRISGYDADFTEP